MDPTTYTNAVRATQELKAKIHSHMWTHYHGILRSVIRCDIEFIVHEADKQIGVIILRTNKSDSKSKEIQMQFRTTPKGVEFYDENNEPILEFRGITRKLKDTIET